MSRPGNGSTTNLAIREDDNSRGLKIENPKPFDGKPQDFQAYKNQVRACLKFKTLPSGEQQVIWAASFLEGRARGWLEPHMEDLLDHPRRDDQKPRTRELFGDVGTYLKDLGKVFGGTDQTKEAARKLRALRQTGSVHQYTAEFQQLAARLQYDEDAMKNSFYFGLKDFIKDKLSEREDEPDGLDELIEAATKIDDRAWERKMEKSQGRSGYHEPKYRNQNRANQGRQRRHPDAMDWEANAVVKNHGNKKFAPKKSGKPKMTKEQSTRFKNGECLNCGKKGHYAKECRSTGKQVNMAEKPTSEAEKTPADDGTSAGPVEATLTISDKRHPDHANISWTGCYDDYCFIHKSEKEGQGWYPKKPRTNTKKQVNTHVRTTRTPDTIVETYDGCMIVNTHQWRQVRDREDPLGYGHIVWDKTQYQPIPLHVVMAKPPQDELEEASSTTKEPELPHTQVQGNDERYITVLTDQWQCHHAKRGAGAGPCGRSEPINCAKVYRPQLQGCGEHATVKLLKMDEHLARSTGHVGEARIYTIASLARLPRKEEVQFPEHDQDESEYSSSNDNDEECPVTTVTGWSNDKLIVRTNRWFEDWCTDPECEQDAQHQHKFHMPEASIQKTEIDSTWEICHSRKCDVTRWPHAHQHCMIKAAKSCRLAYFRKLPRQDTPGRVRHDPELDATQEVDARMQDWLKEIDEVIDVYEGKSTLSENC